MLPSFLMFRWPVVFTVSTSPLPTRQMSLMTFLWEMISTEALSSSSILSALMAMLTRPWVAPSA